MNDSNANLGLIGLAVMGSNLARNMARNGHTVHIYNRTSEVTDELMAGPGKGSGLVPYHDLGEFCRSLTLPRRIILMVMAGGAVDTVINQLAEYLEPGDLIVDGGNSLFTDSRRRHKEAVDRGHLFMGLGVSGGEEGALWGPSLMPGGSQEAYRMLEPVLKDIAADVNGEPCVTYIGDDGAGHFVKMVHNGIEYGDMQLIAEAYDILSRGFGLKAADISSIFADWNQGDLSSYLIEITAEVLAAVDEKTGLPMVEVILDKAGQKGTGLWTVQNALDMGVSAPTIYAAVNGRVLSAYKDQRVEAAGLLAGPEKGTVDNIDQWIGTLGRALYLAKICSYAQGFDLMRAAAKEYGWQLSYGEIARIWRGGCIIRARLLEEIRAAYAADPALPNLLTAPALNVVIDAGQKALRKVVAEAVKLGIPAPALSGSLAYYDAYRSDRLPANLIQAQRDYFGAHTYARTDMEGVFHADWAAAVAASKQK